MGTARACSAAYMLLYRKVVGTSMAIKLALQYVNPSVEEGKHFVSLSYLYLFTLIGTNLGFGITLSRAYSK